MMVMMMMMMPLPLFIAQQAATSLVHTSVPISTTALTSVPYLYLLHTHQYHDHPTSHIRQYPTGLPHTRQYLVRTLHLPHAPCT